MALTLNYVPTPDDLVARTLWLQRRSPSARRQEMLIRFVLPVGLLGAFILVVAGNVGQAGRQLDEYRYWALFIGVLMLWMFCYPYQVKWLIRQRLIRWSEEQRGKGLFVERNLTIDDHGICSSSAISTTTFPWSAVELIETTPHRTFIAMHGLQCVTIPRTAFGSDDDYDAFVVALRSFHERKNP